MRSFLSRYFSSLYPEQYWFTRVTPTQAIKALIDAPDPAWDKAKADAKAKHDRAQTPKPMATVTRFRARVEPVSEDWHAAEHFQGEHAR